MSTVLVETVSPPAVTGYVTAPNIQSYLGIVPPSMIPPHLRPITEMRTLSDQFRVDIDSTLSITIVPLTKLAASVLAHLDDHGDPFYVADYEGLLPQDEDQPTRIRLVKRPEMVPVVIRAPKKRKTRRRST